MIRYRSKGDAGLNVMHWDQQRSAFFQEWG